MGKKNYLWPLLMAISLSFGVVAGGYFAGKGASFSVKEQSGRIKLNKLIDLIEDEYVDNVNTDSIIDRAVNNILAQLDPHSIYISRSEFEDVQNAMRGSFVGIGINYYVLNDTLAIVKPLKGGPSEKAGLKAGDRILFADNAQLFNKGINNDSIVSLIRGVEGSKTQLKIYRKSTGKIFDVVITRGEVPLRSVDTAIKIDEQRGYIKVNRFSETTYKEFREGLERLLEQGISELILDLRENGGGYMEPAIQMANDFLKKEDVIVKTVNKKGNVRITQASTKGLFVDEPLYILINENSASASEIIAGAIQDNDRGVIVGRRSYGKGLVQREMYLGDGSAVRLTTSRYYTPSGRSIQKPYMDGLDEYNNDLSNRFKSGELYSKDSIHLPDSLKYRTVGGRVVFGGGGIVPDVFVPLKTKHGEDAIQLLMKTSLVSYYVFEEIERERDLLERMSAEDLAAKIYDDPKYFNDLKMHLKSSGLTFNLERHRKSIMFYLVGEYIHQLYDDDAYYHWVLQEDPMIQKIYNLK